MWQLLVAFNLLELFLWQWICYLTLVTIAFVICLILYDSLWTCSLRTLAYISIRQIPHDHVTTITYVYACGCLSPGHSQIWRGKKGHSPIPYVCMFCIYYTKVSFPQKEITAKFYHFCFIHYNIIKLLRVMAPRFLL